MPQYMFRSLRSDFPFFGFHPTLGYLDNASTMQKPRQVIAAMNRFYESGCANVGRGVYRLAETATAQYEEVRDKVARFIGARSPQEIVFTHGATEAINMVALAWAKKRIKPGQEIVISALEHHANFLVWQAVSHELGIELRVLPIDDHGFLRIDLLDQYITTKTALVAVCHTSNAIGTVNNLSPIIQVAHKVGAFVLVDGAQAVSHERINVVDLDVDFLSFSAHKMGGPTGVGVLYIRSELHDQFDPYLRGGGMVLAVSKNDESIDPEWRKIPHLLEAGTPPIAAVIGLGASVDYLMEKIDWTRLKEHETTLAAALIAGLRKNRRIRILGSPDHLIKRGHMVSFVVEDRHAHDVAAWLDFHGICVRAGTHCAQPLAQRLDYTSSLRVSFSFYNTLEEVDRVIKALDALPQF